MAVRPRHARSVRLFERAAGLRVDGVLTQREVRTLKRAARSGGMAGAVSLRSTTTAQSGQSASSTPPNQPTGQVAPPPPAAAQVGANGLAVAPAGAPAAVAAIIQAGNIIAHMPYRFGGGRQSWQDKGYDCSGSVSYALHGAGLRRDPARLVRLLHLGRGRPGAVGHRVRRDDHAYMVVAGLRYDTSASKAAGRAGRPPDACPTATSHATPRASKSGSSARGTGPIGPS